MASRAWFSRALVLLLLAVLLTQLSAGPARADHRHGGWYGHGWHDGGRHWRHRHHGHRHSWHHHRHHHHHDGFSASFLFDLTPPPRRVYVVPPPPLIVQPPPVVYRAPPPAYCREYSTTVLVNGRPVETYGTACLQPDGRWKIVSMN